MFVTYKQHVDVEQQKQLMYVIIPNVRDVPPLFGAA